MAKQTHESFSNKAERKWPENCIWPKPLESGEGELWDDEEASLLWLDEDGEYYLEIKEYMDKLVAEGMLNDDYSLNEKNDADEEWVPDIGEDYWDEDGFNYLMWQYDFSDHMNLLKLPVNSFDEDPVRTVTEAIGYEFINENILRQAFTRRAFAAEYKIGDSEELEFIGDSVLGIILTKSIADHLTSIINEKTASPFDSHYSEGDFTKIRSHFVNKEYLSKRASELGLDQLILYGSNETESESAKEDMVEALIGAVAVDCNWDWTVIEGVVDRLVCIQLAEPDRYLRQTYYDLFNSWHQKHFGTMPDYHVYRTGSDEWHDQYGCTIRFRVPENKSGIETSQVMAAEEATRSLSRERAAMSAYRFVVKHGLWIRLEDAHLTPSMDESINQLQELYQKKYLDTLPEYYFEEKKDQWHCDCVCGGVNGYGTGISKIKAKKKAAYMVLVRLLDAAGICDEEWKRVMWSSLSD